MLVQLPPERCGHSGCMRYGVLLSAVLSLSVVCDMNITQKKTLPASSLPVSTCWHVHIRSLITGCHGFARITLHAPLDSFRPVGSTVRSRSAILPSQKEMGRIDHRQRTTWVHISGPVVSTLSPRVTQRPEDFVTYACRVFLAIVQHNN